MVVEEKSLLAEFFEGAGVAAGTVFGGKERLRLVKNLVEEIVEVVEELILHCGDIGDEGFAEDEGRVIVVGARVLNEQQAGGDRGESERVRR